VCDHHEFRGGSLEYEVNHLVIGRTHDHFCKWLRVQLPKIEHVFKRLSKPTTMEVTCQVVASLSLY
jgi:hypothetical protein